VTSMAPLPVARSRYPRSLWAHEVMAGRHPTAATDVFGAAFANKCSFPYNGLQMEARQVTGSAVDTGVASRWSLEYELNVAPLAQKEWPPWQPLGDRRADQTSRH
jgi:hypothetical protein